MTIVERDDLPAGPESRRGVPQGRHAHGLLKSGEQVVRRYFPGLMEELIEGGARRVTASEGCWYQYGGVRVDTPDAPDAVFLSRPFLEDGVRRHLTARPGISFVKASVSGLLAARSQVRGVTLKPGSEVDDDELVADVVVDTTGRGSAAPVWLRTLRFPEPPLSSVKMDMTYGSRLYRRTDDFLPSGTWAVVVGDPRENRRFGVAFPVEGNRWIVTLGGVHGDRPPTEEDGYAAFARTLPTDAISRIVEKEEPLGEIIPYRMPSSVWHHYEKSKEHPAGFIVLGDAICSFNPAYGQGMSSAFLQAAALGDCLERRDVSAPDLPKAFYKAAAKIIVRPWTIAAGGDFCFEATTGDKPPMTDLINRYVEKAVIAGHSDPVVATAIFEVQNLLVPPQYLMKPKYMARVLRAKRVSSAATASRTFSPPD